MIDQITSGLLNSQYIIPIFLFMIFGASYFSFRIKIPYAMILVGFGIALPFLHYSGLGIFNFGDLKIDPKLILYFVVPALIFESMMRINYDDFKTVRISTLLMATVGTVIAMIVGGFLLAYLAGLPLIMAFAFSALIASTDAAVVIEVFRRVKVPKPLANLMETEASLNDATSAVLFSLVVSIAVAGGLTLMSNNDTTQINVNILEQIVRFVIVFFGGAAVGLVFAIAAHLMHKILDDPLSGTGITVAIVFGSVVTANSLGVSGLVAVAIAGLYVGNISARKEQIMSKKAKTYAFHFWEVIAFFANSLAFLYLGLSMDIIKIGQNIPLIAIAFVVVLIGRAVPTYSILGVINRFTNEKIPKVWRNVAMIGSMRGALSIALVGTLPESSFKDTLQTITFGVVLASLIIQYIGLSKYAKKVFPNTITDKQDS